MTEKRITAVGTPGTFTTDLSWKPATNAPEYQQLATVDTTDATQTTLWTRTQDDESFTDYGFTVIGRGSNGKFYRADFVTAYNRTAGVLTSKRALTKTDEFTETTWVATVDTSGAALRVRGTGAVGVTVRWSVEASLQVVKIAGVGGGGGFDPASLTLGLWVRGFYAGVPWNGTASAGGSGSVSLLEATNPPTAGAMQRGFVPAQFNGTNSKLDNASAMSTVVTAGAGSVWVLIRANTTAATSGTVRGDALLFGDSQPYFSLNISSLGVAATVFDVGWKETPWVACSTGAYHLVQCKWDSTNLKIRVDGGAWQSVACGAIGSLAGSIVSGLSYTGVDFDGRILEIGAGPNTESDATFDKVKAFINTRYGLAL